MRILFLGLFFSAYSFAALAMGDRYDYVTETPIAISPFKPSFIYEDSNEQQAQQDSLKACYSTVRTLPFNRIEFTYTKYLKDLGCSQRTKGQITSTFCKNEVAIADFKLTSCSVNCQSHSFPNGLTRARCTATYVYIQTSPVRKLTQETESLGSPYSPF